MSIRQKLLQKNRQISRLRVNLRLCRENLRLCRENLQMARSNPVTTSFAKETKSNAGGRRTRRKQKGGHHLYKRLGVSKYSSKKQIRKAFKTLKKKRKATKKVKEAYKILSRKKTRKQYNNRYRKAVKRGGKSSF